jgi:hypothetical protein
MRILLVAGTLLLAFGLFALSTGGIRYTRDKTVVQVGALKATTPSHEYIPLPRTLGGVAVAAGIALLIVGARRRP